ncbi:N-acetyltransferase [Erythrobacter litoralis]|uniref:GNAT family N-acetyltransferase n=1 Tax=Erythrobacter litoralis TaxID=39960 RepID=UPI002436030A|nr:GNAT family N-acetyltransferase [Erythrobacter litoralis]MDG6080314.1 N-acetyltransferase [Erythrobacter litoralis]
MFHKTQRLLLRPAWIEDAPAILAGIGEEAIVRNLAHAPWPYKLADAQDFARRPQDACVPHFLVHLPGEGVIGSAGFGSSDGETEIGYWIARRFWGRGFATEAARALVSLAPLLGHSRLVAGHFADNPASGKVLRKIGFRPTGRRSQRYSAGRGEAATLVEFEMPLVEHRPTEDLKQAA